MGTSCISLAYTVAFSLLSQTSPGALVWRETVTIVIAILLTALSDTSEHADKDLSPLFSTVANSDLATAPPPQSG